MYFTRNDPGAFKGKIRTLEYTPSVQDFALITSLCSLAVFSLSRFLELLKSWRLVFKCSHECPAGDSATKHYCCVILSLNTAGLVPYGEPPKLGKNLESETHTVLARHYFHLSPIQFAHFQVCLTYCVYIKKQKTKQTTTFYLLFFLRLPYFLVLCNKLV